MKFLLYPFALLFRMIVSVRNSMYETNILKQHEFNIPIISIGNISVGGTGKTPHAEYLMDLLHNKFQIAFLSRGYKRKSKGYVRADDNSTSFDIGDEPMQIAHKFSDVPVAVCENRVKGVQKLLEESNGNLDTIILDDAFQHRKIKPQINILLIDYNNPIHTDEMLPVGRLREPIKGRFRANIIIVTKCPKKLTPIDQRIIRKELEILPYQNLFFSTFEYGALQNSLEQQNTIPNEELKSYSIVLLTGIANCEPLIDYLQSKSKEITHCQYADHHRFTNTEIANVVNKFEKIENPKKIIVTTEKDMARIIGEKEQTELLGKNLYVIPIVVKFLDEYAELFNKKITNYVTENKSNSQLHKRKNLF